MKVLVCGGRFFTDKQYVFEVLDKLYRKHKRLVVIEGGATGADHFARQWVKARLKEGFDVSSITVCAQWKLYGKQAGPIRNQHMLDTFKPDLVVAFRGQKGTADMVRRARAAKVRVRDLRT